MEASWKLVVISIPALLSSIYWTAQFYFAVVEHQLAGTILMGTTLVGVSALCSWIGIAWIFYSDRLSVAARRIAITVATPPIVFMILTAIMTLIFI